MAKGNELATIGKLAAAGGLAYLAYTQFFRDKLTLEAKLSRRIAFVPNLDPDTALGYAYRRALGNISFTSVALPMLKAAFYAASMQAAIKAKLATIEANYGELITKAATLTNVPYQLILSTIYLESEGNRTVESPAKAIGLMQVTALTALDVLTRENIKGRLTPGEKEALRKVLGTRLDAIARRKNLGHTVAGANVTRTDLFNAEFNILVGAIYLGQLLDEHKEEGTYRLDKVIARYNMGYFSMGSGKKLTGTPAQIVSRLPAEPAAYIKKLVGVNGVLMLT